MAQQKKLQKSSLPQLIFVDKLPWFWLWGIIYLAIVVFGLFWPTSIFVSILKIFGIALCLVFVWRYFHEDRLIQIAFLFTLTADIILAFNNTAAYGVLVFAFAQLTHFARICQKPTLSKIWLIVSILLLVCIFVLPIPDPIVCFGIVYGITLAANLFMSLRYVHQERNRKTVCNAIGFTLFVCCDLLVAVSFFANIGVLPGFLLGIANYCCWLFYLPSQIFIANSGEDVIQ